MSEQASTEATAEAVTKVMALSAAELRDKAAFLVDDAALTITPVGGSWDRITFSFVIARG